MSSDRIATSEPNIYGVDAYAVVERRIGKEGHAFIAVNERRGFGTVAIPLADLVAAVNDIPGVTATYEVPVEVPTNYGAMIETKDGNRYLLVDGDSTPWRGINEGPFLSVADVEAVLRAGGKVLSEGVPG